MFDYNNLPEELKNKNDGYSYAKGYIRFLGESESGEIEKIVSNSDLWQGGVPFAVTPFGDILVWYNNYVYLYDFALNDYSVILSGSKFFMSNIEDPDYQDDFFDMSLLDEAINKVGALNGGNCYTLEPMPSIGGAKEIKYIGIGDLKVYLTLLI